MQNRKLIIMAMLSLLTLSGCRFGEEFNNAETTTNIETTLVFEEIIVTEDSSAPKENMDTQGDEVIQGGTDQTIFMEPEKIPTQTEINVPQETTTPLDVEWQDGLNENEITDYVDKADSDDWDDNDMENSTPWG